MSVQPPIEQFFYVIYFFKVIVIHFFQFVVKIYTK